MYPQFEGGQIRFTHHDSPELTCDSGSAFNILIVYPRSWSDPMLSLSFTSTGKARFPRYHHLSIYLRYVIPVLQSDRYLFGKRIYTNSEPVYRCYKKFSVPVLLTFWARLVRYAFSINCDNSPLIETRTFKLSDICEEKSSEPTSGLSPVVARDDALRFM